MFLDLLFFSSPVSLHGWCLGPKREDRDRSPKPIQRPIQRPRERQVQRPSWSWSWSWREDERRGAGRCAPSCGICCEKIPDWPWSEDEKILPSLLLLFPTRLPLLVPCCLFRLFPGFHFRAERVLFLFCFGMVQGMRQRIYCVSRIPFASWIPMMSSTTSTLSSFGSRPHVLCLVYLSFSLENGLKHRWTDAQTALSFSLLPFFCTFIHSSANYDSYNFAFWSMQHKYLSWSPWRLRTPKSRTTWMMYMKCYLLRNQDTIARRKCRFAMCFIQASCGRNVIFLPYLHSLLTWLQN